MFHAQPALPSDRSFEQILSQLETNPHVHGLLTIGSRPLGRAGPESDFDLVVVVDDALASLSVALTTIEGRLADLIFVTSGQLERWPEPVGERAWAPARLAHWLRGGQIAFDRHGRLADAQRRAQALVLEETSDTHTHYATWFGVNYNLAQNRRMWRSADPTYRLAVELRLLYSLNEVWHAYFRLRDLPQRGEKEQIRYLAEADPAFLHDFQALLGEREADQRLTLYVSVAAIALAPAGGLWPEAASAVLCWPPNRGVELEPDAPRAAWRMLFEEEAW